MGRAGLHGARHEGSAIAFSVPGQGGIGKSCTVQDFCGQTGFFSSCPRRAQSAAKGSIGDQGGIGKSCTVQDLPALAALHFYSRLACKSTVGELSSWQMSRAGLHGCQAFEDSPTAFSISKAEVKSSREGGHERPDA
jgi:hypothetical protein